MNESQMQDLVNFVEAAMIVRYDPPCAITAMMTTYGVSEMSEEELSKEAIELSEWLSKNTEKKEVK